MSDESPGVALLARPRRAPGGEDRVCSGFPGGAWVRAVSLDSHTSCFQNPLSAGDRVDI